MAADKKTKNNNASIATAFSDSCNRQQAEVSDPSKPKIGRARLLRSAGQACCNAGVPAAVLLFLAYSLAATAHRAGADRPWDLAFVAFAYADLAALFQCLRRAERLPREPSPAEGQEKRRLQLAVWALSSSLSCAFAFRLSSLIMPAAALVILVWSMTAFVVLVGFFVLVCLQ